MQVSWYLSAAAPGAVVCTPNTVPALLAFLPHMLTCVALPCPCLPETAHRLPCKHSLSGTHCPVLTVQRSLSNLAAKNPVCLPLCPLNLAVPGCPCPALPCHTLVSSALSLYLVLSRFQLFFSTLALPTLPLSILPAPRISPSHRSPTPHSISYTHPPAYGHCHTHARTHTLLLFLCLLVLRALTRSCSRSHSYSHPQIRISWPVVICWGWLSNLSRHFGLDPRPRVDATALLRWTSQPCNPSIKSRSFLPTRRANPSDHPSSKKLDQKSPSRPKLRWPRTPFRPSPASSPAEPTKYLASCKST